MIYKEDILKIIEKYKEYYTNNQIAVFHCVKEGNFSDLADDLKDLFDDEIKDRDYDQMEMDEYFNDQS